MENRAKRTEVVIRHNCLEGMSCDQKNWATRFRTFEKGLTFFSGTTTSRLQIKHAVSFAWNLSFLNCVPSRQTLALVKGA